MYDFFIALWFYLDYNNQFSKNQIINGNIIKLTHSISASMITYGTLHYNIDYQILYNFSKTYFIWDTIKVLLNGKIDYNVLYHHLVILYILKQLLVTNNYNEIILDSYLVGELSNISIFITYHMIKNKYSLYSINISKFLQIIFYGYCRVYLLSTYMYNYYNIVDNYIVLFILSSVYSLGILWWLIQINKFINGNKIVMYINNRGFPSSKIAMMSLVFMMGTFTSKYLLTIGMQMFSPFLLENSLPNEESYDLTI